MATTLWGMPVDPGLTHADGLSRPDGSVPHVAEAVTGGSVNTSGK